MPRVLIAFDGPIWAKDEPAPGAGQALAMLEFWGYEIVILSSRPSEEVRRLMVECRLGAFPVTDTVVDSLALIDNRAVHHIDWTGSLNELARRHPPAAHGVLGSL